MNVTGWKLPRDGQRERLIELFPPTYERTIADHVTLEAHVGEEAKPPGAVEAMIVGIADDSKGVECLVVQIDGTTDRPDGSTYHITWSLGPGRKARESNDVLRDQGWDRIGEPVPVELEPAKFEW